ncbi:MAG: helix-turn-helix transcriptional regulator [Chitinophagaceae bacterium]|jgi:DNA-binding CsgD family transcriptional regulator|nr:helix-turn-helix transcriptional regulator [Chitinophagaceae bacterium]
MKIESRDFFKPINLKDYPAEKNYEEIKGYINAAKIFSQSTYQSIYIIDYYKKGFLYVSDNPLFLCGNKPSVVEKMGYYFYLKYVPENDLELLLEYNVAGFSFYNDIPINERLQYIISYDFHLIQPNKRLLLINHKLAPLLLDKSSNIWLALCVVSVSSNEKAGNAFIQKIGSDKKFIYSTENKKWQSEKITKLTGIEKEILLLSIQGITMNEIAQKVNLTQVTIKFHRSNIFEKLKVKNIAEAIACAANHKLI